LDLVPSPPDPMPIKQVKIIDNFKSNQIIWKFNYKYIRFEPTRTHQVVNFIGSLVRIVTVQYQIIIILN
jgi:hypothetical protein